MARKTLGTKDSSPKVDRRKFLTGVAVAGAAGAMTGKVLAPDPMPLETFVAFVRSTDRAMPPYSEKILPNEDLADMHAYLSTIPKPKDYKSIPLLSQ